jgi:preprotein translocase subunit SecA
MMESIKEETVGYVFNAEIVLNDETAQPVEADEAPAEVSVKGFGRSAVTQTQLEYSAPSETGEATTTFVSDAQAAQYRDVSRNDTCPCGSGKKFKRCHGDPSQS